MNPIGLLFLLLTVAGLAGLNFVTVPGFEYMIGAADGDPEANIIGVVIWIFILWISTAAFVGLTIGGLVFTFIATQD